MGLDMYLYAETYLSGYRYQRDNPKWADETRTFDTLTALTGIEPCEDSPHVTVRTCVAYWRKANQVHAWFVEHVQKGVDDCGYYYVSDDQLKALRSQCDLALGAVTVGMKSTAAEIMPPREGFFFGGTDIDEWYVEDLKSTITQIDRVLTLSEGKPLDFHYHSSW